MKSSPNDPNRVNIELPNGEIISVAKAPILFVEEGILSNPKARIRWENIGMSGKHRKRKEKQRRKENNAVKKSDQNRQG